MRARSARRLPVLLAVAVAAGLVSGVAPAACAESERGDPDAGRGSGPRSAPAPAGPVFPLGHHVHEFQRKAEYGRQRAQGWDPTFSLRMQADKDHLTAGVKTYPVGLPGDAEPGDLPGTACPRNTTIDGSLDVWGLPTVKLSGVADPVPLVAGCDRSGERLCLVDGMTLAVWGSAFRKIDSTCGKADGARLWLVDSLVDAGPDENAGVACGGIVCRISHTEILGGNDIVKAGRDDVFHRSHLHGYDRDSEKGSAKKGGEHSDGVQTQASAGDVTLWNVTIDGPFRSSNAPVWISGGDIHGVYIADSLLVGGTHAFKASRKRRFTLRDLVMVDTQLLADGKLASYSVGPCSDRSGGAFRGAGNRPTGAPGPGFDVCNRGEVTQADRARLEATRREMDRWVDEIRAAAKALGGPLARTSSVD